MDMDTLLMAMVDVVDFMDSISIDKKIRVTYFCPSIRSIEENIHHRLTDNAEYKVANRDPT